MTALKRFETRARTGNQEPNDNGIGDSRAGGGAGAGVDSVGECRNARELSAGTGGMYLGGGPCAGWGQSWYAREYLGHAREGSTSPEAAGRTYIWRWRGRPRPPRKCNMEVRVVIRRRRDIEMED
ncbi:hypothetical protein EDB85DRAFT_1892815 [Lactarius pseudohatsudake]|nr:hypothetical protein EDB85DRAFT_1892815 [Lactarius pseudohatsudake]